MVLEGGGAIVMSNVMRKKTMSQSMAKQPEGRVRTLSEVAALLRISRGSAYEAAKRKEIPTIRIGRRLLVPSDALERLLSGNPAF